MALDAGFRHLDTAAAYLNERAIGEGIASSKVPREEILVSGKLWRTKRTARQVMRACKQTLRQLGTDYLDLYLMHWPASPEDDEAWAIRNAEVWGAMETLLTDGLVRAIGVCNFLPYHIEELAKTWSVVPAVNQIELHPGILREELLECNERHGIATQAWSPLANGKLLGHPIIAEVAKSANATAAQVCLRWCQCHGATPITASKSIAHMKESLACASITLTREQICRIDEMEPFGESGMTALGASAIAREDTK